MRNWFDNSFQHPDKIKTRHTALYMYIIDHANRLGWKEKFGLPTVYTMEAIGILNYRTYDKTLQDLIEWGFIDLIHKSRNQHSANVIALVKNTKAKSKALQNAILNHGISTGEIVKPQTNKPLNHKQFSEVIIDDIPKKEREIFNYAARLFKMRFELLNTNDIPTDDLEKMKYKNWIGPFKKLLKKGFNLDQIRLMIEYLENPKNIFWRKSINDSQAFLKHAEKILVEISNSKPSNLAAGSSELQEKLKSYE